MAVVDIHDRHRSGGPLRRSQLWTILAASALILSAGNVADPDLWGHVRFGQDLLAARGVPATCTHTFTASDHPWINQEWLSQMIFAAIGALSGPPGWLIMKALLGLGVFALMIRDADRRGVSSIVVAAVILLAAYNVAPGWNVRPHIFTYALFASMILVLDRRFASHEAADAVRAPVLWPVPLLFIPWANLHGGFFAGFCVLAAYLVCRSVEAVWRRGWEAARPIGHYGMIVAAAAVVTLLNPYGVHLHAWLLRDALQPPTDISEWMPLHVGDLRFIPFVLLLGVTVAAWLFSRTPRDTTQTVLLAVMVWQSLAHVRHIPFFAILTGFWLPPHLEDLRRRLIDRPSPVSTMRRVRAMRAGLWLTAVGLAAALAVRSRAVWVDESLYPVRAFEFMTAHRLVGRLVVQIDWAQYAIAAFAPDTTVGFDLRLGCYPRAIADMNWTFFLGAAREDEAAGRQAPSDGNGEEVLRLGEPNLVLLNRRFPHPVDVLQIERVRALVDGAQPDWVLLYQDELTQLWGRRNLYDQPASRGYLPPSERRITDDRQAGFLRWPALPEKLPSRNVVSRPENLR